MYPDKNKFPKQPKKFTLLITQSLICFTWWKKYLLMNTFKVLVSNNRVYNSSRFYGNEVLKFDVFILLIKTLNKRLLRDHPPN